MPHLVYIIGSFKNLKLTTYVGYTNNLKSRINKHNTDKGAKFTKGRLWKIMYYEKYKTRRKALKREYFLKKHRKLRNIIKDKFINNENINTITI